MGNYSWGSCFNKTTSVASVAAICSPVVGMGCRVSCCSGTPSVGEDKLFVPGDDGASVHHLDGKWRDRETAGEFDSILQMPFTEVILSRSCKESPITEKLGFKTLFNGDDVKRKLKDSEISLSDHENVEENPTDESADSSSTNLEVNTEDKDMSLPDNEVEKEADCPLEKSEGDEEEKKEKKPEFFTAKAKEDESHDHTEVEKEENTNDDDYKKLLTNFPLLSLRQEESELAEPVTTGSLLDTPQGIYIRQKKSSLELKKLKHRKESSGVKGCLKLSRRSYPHLVKMTINHYIYSVFFRIFYILTLLLN